MIAIGVCVMSACTESTAKTAAARPRRPRGLKDDDMLQWLSGSADSQARVDSDGSPFALLSASAYVITRVQLHAAFSIFFQARSAAGVLLVLLVSKYVSK